MMHLLNKIRASKLFIVCGILGSLLVILIVLAIGNMYITQLQDLQGIMKMIADPRVMWSILTSLFAALVSTLLSLLLGVPLGYLLARKNFPGKGIIEGITDIPLMIPHVVAGIALYGVFMQKGIIGAPLKEIGIVVTDHFSGIVIAMLFMSFPYVINTARDAFKAINPRLENVARSLGASQFSAFWEVSLPLASKSILSGAIMSWGRGISEFSAVLILAYHPISAPIMIFEKFTSFGLKASRPISVILISICLVIFIILRVLNDRTKKYT